MTSDKYVTAIFVQEQVQSTVVNYQLAVSVVGAGIVQVVPGNPGPGYASGTLLRLTPEARTGWTFQTWSGACAGTDLFCSITMDEAKSVGALFTATGAPDQVLDAWMQPQPNGTSLISWTAASGATQYVITVGGKNVTTCALTQCELNRIVGPNDVVQIIARNSAKAAEPSTAAQFVAPTRQLQLFTVNFNSGSAQLTDRAKKTLRNAITRITNLGYTKLTIVGHTDNRELRPRVLSEARAAAVARFIGNAVDIEFVTSGKAATSALTTNSTIVGRAANRRAVGSVG